MNDFYKAIRDTWLLWDGGLKDKVPEIKKTSDNFLVEKAKIFTGDAPETIRKSEIRWVNTPVIQSLLWPFVSKTADHLEIHVTNEADIQYTEYDSEYQGHFNWHTDVNWSGADRYDRKMSVTVQLTDPLEYEGGDFEFSEVENPKSQLKNLGTVLVFPPYLRHRVSPVTRGKRASLVAWFYGPRWR